MRKRLYKNIGDLYDSCKLDQNENDFLDFSKNYNQEKKTKKEFLFVEMQMDYSFLLRVFYLTSKCNFKTNKIVCYWPYIILPFPSEIKTGQSFYLACVLSEIKYFLLNIKWRKLYKSLKPHRFLTLTSHNPLLKFKCFFEARKIFLKISTKEELLELNYEGIKFGDLVYDSYLRFCNKPTIDLTDKKLLYIIFKSLECLKVLEVLNSKYKINSILNLYSSYVHHGLVARFFLKEQKNVFVDGNYRDTFKKLSLDDFLHTPSYFHYKREWEQLSNQDELKKQARDNLHLRFSGKIDRSTLYMKKSAFALSKEDFNEDVDGVVFLHDFFDSPHIYRSMIFDDLWIWGKETLDFISKNKKKIAIKPHPNQSDSSIKYVNQLKEMYPDLIWIPSSVSNSKIFNSKIKYGISVYGTVLYELAYHNIVPIACGEYPGLDFNIAYLPKTKNEYFDFILNAENLKLSENIKDIVETFFAIHSLGGKSHIENYKDTYHLKFLNPDDSNSLTKFITKQKDYNGK